VRLTFFVLLLFAVLDPLTPLAARVQAAAADANVVTDRDRYAVYGIDALWIGKLGRLPQQPQHPLPEDFRDGVPAAIEAALGEHRLDVAMLFEEASALFLVAVEEGGGHKGCGHDLGGTHPGLGIIAPAAYPQEVIAEAVDRDDLSGHFLLRMILLRMILGILLLHGGPRLGED
jgi:hypothetical protein